MRHTADLICFGNAPAYFSSSGAYRLFQNWKYWMEMGWLDAGTPMNYKRETESDEAQWYRNWVDAAIDWRYDRHMYCGQANYLNSKADSVTQLQYVYGAGADGSMNYSYYENTSSGTDWTWYTYVADNLFTEPAATPPMPWRDPATADEGTLWGRITDYDTGLPIDDASVQVGTLSAVKTDGNGYYVVTLISATESGTEYDVSATKTGYPTANAVDVNVIAGDVQRRDIALGAPALPGDMDQDGDVDLDDLAGFKFCLAGPDYIWSTGHYCARGDSDEDRDVDAADYASFQRLCSDSDK